MRDPERLLRRPPNDFTASLLRAGAEEKPSSAALRRTLQVAAVGTAIGASLQATSAGAAVLGAKSSLAGLGGASVASGAAAGGAAGAGMAAVSGAAAVGAATSAAAGNGVAVLTAVAIAKWVGVGAVGGVMAATAAHRLAPGSLSAVSVPRASSSAWVAPAPPRPEPAAPRRAPFASGVSAGFAEPATVSEPSREPPVPPVLSDNAATPPRPPPAPETPVAAAQSRAVPKAPVQPAQVAATPLLAAEVALVDRGRAALQRGDGAGALLALAGYEAAFPKQQLSPEVLFLRMEAFARMGNQTQAQALAQRIVARGAAGPQAVRAREILGH